MTPTHSLSHHESSFDDDQDYDDGTEMASTTHQTNSKEEATSTTDDMDDIQQTVIKREEALVRGARILVCSIVILCAAAVCGSIFYFGTQGDKRSFEVEYESLTRDISNNVLWEIRYNMALMEQLSSHITSQANTSKSTFPFVTDIHFEVNGGYVDGMGGIVAVAFAPLVTSEQRPEWEAYAVANQGWLQESQRLKIVHPLHRDALHGTIQDHEHDRRERELQQTQDIQPIIDMIYRWDGDRQMVEPQGVSDQLYAPIWQLSPPEVAGVNFNLLSDARIYPLYEEVLKTKASVMSSPANIDDMLVDFWFDEDEKDDKKEPHAILLVPVFARFDTESEIVGIVLGITSYRNLVSKLLPDTAKGIYVVFEDTCGTVLTFELDGQVPIFKDTKDVHEAGYDQYRYTLHNIQMYQNITADTCELNLHMYPSARYEESFQTSNTILFISVGCLAVIIVVFLILYDYMVNKRHKKTMQTAANSQALVTSLFPKEVGRRLIREATEQQDTKLHNKANLKSLLIEHNKAGDGNGALSKSKPIADLFPECTIMFADLAGFTAWSSVREPSQVFQLLETLFSAFDDIAHCRRVFKVETVGDCYVAVAGLPDPRKDHHIVMARFARDILVKVQVLLAELEMELGGGTSELGVRIGLHSGPVTAGVLRGQRARFQLFGDTMNTCSRVESTGMKNRIHISQDTANRIIASGKQHWVKERSDVVHAKGKGSMITYWLDVKGDKARSSSSGSSGNPESSEERAVLKSLARSGTDSLAQPDNDGGLSPKMMRLVKWNAEMLLKLLREIVARREASRNRSDSAEIIVGFEEAISNGGTNPLDEVKEVITLPKFDKKVAARQKAAGQVEISHEVVDQLHAYVKIIASLYRNNPFHNFEHASHVTMSVTKLLGRIVAPDIDEIAAGKTDVDEATLLHDYTFGITSDPLTQFSCVLAALLHDVDHVGIPNTKLLEENPELAATYKGKSIAEQNSVDIAWDLLMQDEFKDLRHTIYCSVAELKRFRSLVVNSVMATDIMDKELGAQRKSRWNKAFSEETNDKSNECTLEDSNRKATIVIEHLIQASDVAHTMQHWHVYRKWNANLFEEMYKAYKEGRTQGDPSTFWVKGEIGFFDFYIIPLAKKLKSCGVFGVSSDEYLNYALMNRREWEERGDEVVKELIRNCEEKYDRAQ